MNLRGKPGLAYIAAGALAAAPPIVLPGGLTVDLAADPIFFLSLDPTSPYFSSMTGTLDGLGRGQFGLNIPYSPPLLGLRLYTAFATLAGAGALSTISSTTRFVLEP